MSERVGAIIDAEEREYFGLFPDAGTYDHAYCIPSSTDTGYVSVCISTYHISGKKRVFHPDIDSIHMRTEEFKLLGDYLSRFEELKYAHQDDIDYSGIDKQYAPLTDHDFVEEFDQYDAVLVRMKRKDAAEWLKIELLYANNQCIVYNNPTTYGRRFEPVAIPLSEVDSIDHVFPGQFPWELYLLDAGLTGLLITLPSPKNHKNPDFFTGGDDREQQDFAYRAMLATLVYTFTIIYTVFSLISNHYEVDLAENQTLYYKLLSKLSGKLFFNRGLPADLQTLFSCRR